MMIAGLPLDKSVALRVGLVLIAYVALIYGANKNWLRPKESLWIGGAIMFCALGWLMPALGLILRFRFNPTQALALAAAMVVPLIVGMGYGLRIVYKRKMRM